VSTTTAIAIYFLIWWITLFAVLPWGVRSQEESGDFAAGTDPGAPVRARILMKLLWTTVVSGVIFGAFALIYEYRLITLDDMASWFGLRP
jgi:predicted secreted protein